MRSVFLLLYLSFFTSMAYPGFAPETTVLDRQGFMPIGQLQKDSSLTSYDLTKKTVVQGVVTNHNAYVTSYAYRVVCNNGISFVASPNQRVMTSGEWCPPCQQLKPIYQEIASEFEGKVKCAEIDVDSFDDMKALSVNSLPTLLMYKNRVEVSRIVGSKPREELVSEIRQLLQ